MSGSVSPALDAKGNINGIINGNINGNVDISGANVRGAGERKRCMGVGAAARLGVGVFAAWVAALRLLWTPLVASTVLFISSTEIWLASMPKVQVNGEDVGGERRFGIWCWRFRCGVAAFCPLSTATIKLTSKSTDLLSALMPKYRWTETT